jgi:hypothetical protein
MQEATAREFGVGVVYVCHCGFALVGPSSPRCPAQFAEPQLRPGPKKPCAEAVPPVKARTHATQTRMFNLVMIELHWSIAPDEPSRAYRLVAPGPSGDLLLRAKHLFVAARTRQSSTKDRAGGVRRVMVVAGREAYPRPRR